VNSSQLGPPPSGSHGMRSRSVGYACLLEEEPSHLVPTRLLDELWAIDTSQPLIRNPRTFFQGHNWRQPNCYAPDALYHDSWTIWVEDPPTGCLWPYVLGERSLTALRAAEDKHVACSSSDLLRRLLSFTAILIDPDYVTRRVKSWNITRVTSVAAFSERGFVPVSGLLHPFHIGTLRRYYRRLLRTGAFHLGDQQSPLRFVKHNEEVARFFHCQLASVVSQLTGRLVKPSYVYFASYTGGAELPEHVDRPQCEYTLSLCVDFAPEPASDTPWPLRLTLPGESLFVYQRLGDALLYRGRQIPHSRDELASNCSSTSLFFHYVDADFVGPLA
jgi:negative regulator of replication initiation